MEEDCIVTTGLSFRTAGPASDLGSPHPQKFHKLKTMARTHRMVSNTLLLRIFELFPVVRYISRSLQAEL